MRGQSYDRRRALKLALVMAAGAIGATVVSASRAWAETGGYPYADYNGPGSNASEYIWTDSSGQWYSEKYRFAYRNCTDFVAWKLDVTNGWYVGVSMGHAKAWNSWATTRNYVVDMNPAPGAVVWWGAKAHGMSAYGHVAWVRAVEGDTVTIEEYNNPDGGTWGSRSFHKSKVSGYIHFKDLAGNVSGGAAVSSTPQIFQIKRTTDPSGVRQVYAATNTAVTEAWWVPGGDGVHLHEVIKIDQQNIVGFDKVNLPGGTQAVYTATSNGVWETWWKPDGSSGGGQIVSGLSGVKGVIAYNTTENGQFVHHLYILAGDGPYEAWWKDGGDGVHLSRLTNINGGTTFTMAVASDGTMQLYVATPTWVYEVWWTPGSNNIRTGTILNVTQGDIRQLAKAETLTNGTQRLYITTSTTVWESKWGGGLSGIQTTGKVVGQTNAIMCKKMVTGGVDQLYVATGAKVQEYWWTSSNSGGGTLINITQGNIGAIDRVNDGSAQQLYTAAGNWVRETWWGGGKSPSTSVLFSVTH